MLDHTGLIVPADQFDSVVKWYVAALAPLGYEKRMEIPGRAVGLGPAPHDMPFWIGVKEGVQATGVHTAFKAQNHEVVDKFHEEATKAGGKCNGTPGIREQYHPNYYAAFVLDPLG